MGSIVLWEQTVTDSSRLLSVRPPAFEVIAFELRITVFVLRRASYILAAVEDCLPARGQSPSRFPNSQAGWRFLARRPVRQKAASPGPRSGERGNDMDCFDRIMDKSRVCGRRTDVASAFRFEGAERPQILTLWKLSRIAANHFL